MTDTDDALLSAIRAAPEDDAARAVYADHLIARGDPRGEFIQLQLHLAAPGKLDDRAYGRIELRARELVTLHGSAWLAACAAVLPDAAARIELVRGFPDKVWLRVHELSVLPDLVRCAPLIRRVDVLLEPGDSFADELDHVAVSGVSHVRIYAHAGLDGTSDDGTLVPRIAATRWSQLRDLTLWCRHVDDRELAMLSASPHLASLEGLHVYADRATGDGFAAIASGPWRLRALTCVRAPADASLFDALARGAAFRGLRALAVMTSPAAHLVAPLAALPELRSLSLQGDHVDVPALADVLAAITAPLEHLSLPDNRFGDMGAFLIAESPKLAHLRTLAIQRTGIMVDGFAALAASPHLANLDTLHVQPARWTTEIANAVARAPFRTSRRA